MWLAAVDPAVNPFAKRKMQRSKDSLSFVWLGFLRNKNLKLFSKVSSFFHIFRKPDQPSSLSQKNSKVNFSTWVVDQAIDLRPTESWSITLTSADDAADTLAVYPSPNWEHWVLTDKAADEVAVNPCGFQTTLASSGRSQRMSDRSVVTASIVMYFNKPLGWLAYVVDRSKKTQTLKIWFRCLWKTMK